MTAKATQPALRALLLELAKQDAALATKAENALREATERYRSSKPDIDPAGEPYRSGVSADRAAVRKVLKKATELQQAVGNLSIHARHVLGEAMEAPLGTLTGGLESLLQQIPDAMARLQEEKDKAGDYFLSVWAYEVALVLRDILGIEPSATREDEDGRHARGGAAYARLLRHAHALISRRSLDYKRLLDAGLKLLKNPSGDLVDEV